MPHDTTTPFTGGLDPRVLKKLAGAPAHWADGGPISAWKPVHSRHAKTLTSTGQRARFVFTRIATPGSDPVIDGWIRHQDSLVEPRRRSTDALVFWRLAVRQRAFAIDARPRADVPTSLEHSRRLTGKVGRLRVALAFLPGQLVPAWAVHDGVQPVFVGLPDHHLVPTAEIGESLAAIIATARWKPQVHDVVGAPLADAAS